MSAWGEFREREFEVEPVSMGDGDVAYAETIVVLWCALLVFFGAGFGVILGMVFAS